MNEYELLRAEILNCYDSITHYNSLLYTASAAILAFGIERESVLLCLLPYFVILPLHFLCEGKYRMMCKIGAYLYVFLEGDKYKWERRSVKRDVVNEWDGKKVRVVAWRYHLQYYFSLVICTIMAVIIILQGEYTIKVKVLYSLAVFTINILAVVFINVNTVDITKERKIYVEEWERVKEAESKSNLT